MIRTLHLLILMTTVATLISPSQAASHFCVNGNTLKISLDDFYNRDETIVPEIPDEPLYNRLTYKRCKWEIQVNSEIENLQMVLEGIPTEKVNGKNTSQLTMNFENSKSPVSIGMFQVHPLAQRKHFTVQINWDPRTQNRSQANLRILLPLAEHCSRDMLSFHGNCHAVSPVRESVAVAMSNIQGDAQLASFISMTQIKDFIAENSAKLNEYPFRQILDLSQPVRLGMFYNKTDSRILSVVRNESCGCLMLKEVERHEEILVTGGVTGTCGSLRVNESGRAVIEFGDCNSRMLALMSFPETASSVSAAVTECGSDLVRQVAELENRFLLLKARTANGKVNRQQKVGILLDSTSVPESKSDENMLLLYVLCSVLITAAVVFIILVLVIKYIYQSGACHNNLSKLLSDNWQKTLTHHQVPKLKDNDRRLPVVSPWGTLESCELMAGSRPRDVESGSGDSEILA